nr:hypothetical protein Iba_chr11bCG2190 [Ipomoea batatas]
MHSKTTNAQYKSMSPVTNSRILTFQVIEQKSEPPDNPMPLKTEKNEASSVDLNFKSAIKKQKYKLENRVNNGMSEYRRTRFSPFFFCSFAFAEICVVNDGPFRFLMRLEVFVGATPATILCRTLFSLFVFCSFLKTAYGAALA